MQVKPTSAALGISVATFSMEFYAVTAHAAGHGDHGNVSEELLLPSLEIVGAIVVLLVCLALWVWGFSSENEKSEGSTSTSAISVYANKESKPNLEETRAQSATMQWLAMLVGVTVLFLVGQLAAGFYAHSLTLIADSAHTGADVVTYGFTYLVEYLKQQLGLRAGQPHAAAKIDACSALFSVIVVVGASAYATADAIGRLRGDVEAHAGEVLTAEQAEENMLIGPALLGFAITNTIANMLLLAVHNARASSSTAASDSEEMVPPPPPPPPALPASPSVPSLPSLDMVTPPPPVPFCMPEGRSKQREKHRQRIVQPPQPQQQQRRRHSQQNKLTLLHKAFHPNCEGCHLEKNSEEPPSITGTKQQTESIRENLNVYGAMLHLIADVVRSTVILVVGLLVQFRFLGNTTRADAVCALVVSTCVVCGSLPLLRDAAIAFRPQRPETKATACLV